MPHYTYRTALHGSVIREGLDGCHFLNRPSDLTEAARLLADMKCFSDSFEFGFLATSILNDAISSDPAWGPQLMYMAVTCACSAFTDEQKMVAKLLAEQVSMAMGFGLGLGATQPAEDAWATELPYLQHCAGTLLEEESTAPEYWSINHYSGMDMPPEYEYAFGKKALWSKDLRQWPVSAPVLASFLLSQNDSGWMVDVLDEIRETLYDVFNLVELLEKLEVPSHLSDGLRGYWPLTQAYFIGCAKVLVPFHFEKFGMRLVLGATKSSTATELAWQLKRQASAVLPLVLVRRAQKSARLSSSAGGLEDESLPRRLLLSAVDELRTVLDRQASFASAECEAVFTEYLDEIDKVAESSALSDCHFNFHCVGIVLRMFGLENFIRLSSRVVISDVEIAHTVRNLHFGELENDIRGPTRQHSTTHAGPCMARSCTASMSSG